MTEPTDADEAFEFYVYDDLSWRALIDERWTDVRDRLTQWVVAEQLEVIDVRSEETLTIEQVRSLDAELVRRSLVRFRAHGALADHVRSDPEMHHALTTDAPNWALSFTEMVKGLLPRRDTPSLRPPCSPAEMPDVRLALVDGWNRPGWKAAARSGVARARALGTFAMRKHSLSYAVDSYVQYEQRTLRQAQMWWVGEEMCDLLYATADKVPGETTLEHLNLPSVQALVVFAKPWLATDADSGGKKLVVDAITWGPAMLRDDHGDERHALGVSAYRLLDFGEGLSPGELQLATATDAFANARKQLVAKHESGGGQVRTEFNVTGRTWVPLGRSDWPIEASVGDSDTGFDEPIADDISNRDAYMQSAVEDRKIVAALSLLLNTRTMTQLEDGHLPRHVRRRSQRAGVPSTVNVVYLRRPEHARDDSEHDDDKPPVEWSHRWIVSAHPRLQPYGPGRSLRRLIMVPPHVKGPDDKPLVVKPTVNAWVR